MRRFRVVANAVLVLAILGLAPPDVPGAQASRSTQAQGAGKAGPTMTPEALDMLLAPIALYPDQLLAQMLMCATNPPRVGELAAWLKQMKSVKGSALQEAAQKAGFEPSFVALALFPHVVDFMAGDMSWTTQLGQAFSGNRTAVFDSFQRLRAQSREIGNLKSTPQQEVETRTTESGQQVIVIELANPQVGYVPQDARTEEALKALEYEIHDRFGKPPEEVKNLLHIMSLKVMARELLITRIQDTQGRIQILFSSDTKVEHRDIFELRKKVNGKIKFLPEGFELDLRGLPWELIYREVSSIFTYLLVSDSFNSVQ